MSSGTYDVAVVGGGIVGTATAMAITARAPVSLVVLEAEPKLATHQTGNNSGVIHSGLYYKPGSLKARNCVEGREEMYRFCQRHGIPHERCGKLVVATAAHELPALDELERRGRANGLQQLKRLGPDELREHEPAVSGIAGLFVPDTGIVDYVKVTETFAALVEAAGSEVRTDARVEGVARDPAGLVLRTPLGDVRCRALVNCAGLQSDRVARMCGVEPGLTIVPFRGEYYELVPARHHLVRNLIYPVPDPRFPFLGVHFTRMIHGGVEAGPNAVLAFKREGYRRRSFSPADVAELLRYRGFWRMAARYWKMAMGEMYRSASTGAFVRALRRLIPELTRADVQAGGAGVRAQALEPNGLLVDDFRIIEAEHMIHVLNAPSPAATASISIGRTIAEMAVKNFGLEARSRS
ncbi:MAG: L-2-hydroxyglutarate oxidase [Planctomycetes bacterium]|nr:L-2-hydroxyglutarate oxidase [Planctomycetota bacterium]